MDEQPQIEPASISLTMRITNDTTFGLEAFLDPSTNHKFISFEAWQTLQKEAWFQPVR